MKEICPKCLSENLELILTPNTVHWGKLQCKDCKRWIRWISNPIHEGERTQTSKCNLEQVSKYHKMNFPICFICLRNKEQLGMHETLTLDHIIEVSKGGLDSIENLQILCSACHKLKNWARLYLNWHFTEDK
jgi:5-methylcytosine-specific restriction endonuclease McrA